MKKIVKSKFVIILGVELVLILIGILASRPDYFNPTPTVYYGLVEMNTQEKQAFNLNFTNYEGKQEGSLVKALIHRLIANAKTYREEQIKFQKLIMSLQKMIKQKQKIGKKVMKEEK